MLKNWQFNILFFVAIGGALFLLLGSEFGLDINQNPTAVTGIGAILTYVLTQKKTITKDKKKSEDESLNLKEHDHIYQNELEQQEFREKNERKGDHDAP